ncbi:MAG: YciI family protein [Candidatus Promineifilaceae bacterium]|nr:YciI family protein [Anaerolineaceae bacterium]
MRYMLLLYGDEKLGENVTPEQWQAIIEAHNAFTQEAAERGMNPGGEALHPVATAKTVRYEDGHPTLTTDGPFAETKEQLGGYYLIDCQSEAEALEMAAKLPMSTGSVEVRPVIEF